MSQPLTPHPLLQCLQVLNENLFYTFGLACDADIANSMPMAATFGAATGIFALFFFAEVPRVRIDIVEKIPVIGSYFKKEIAPEDNPF